MKEFLLVHRSNGELCETDWNQFWKPEVGPQQQHPIRATNWWAVTFGQGEGAQVVGPSRQRLTGAGVAALENITELLPTNHTVLAQSDVRAAIEYLSEAGIASMRSMLGAFGLVLIEADGQGVTLARDALGLAPVYYRVIEDLLAVSSNAGMLACGCSFDREFIADFLMCGTNPENRTIYQGVYALPPGTIATRKGKALVATKYWSPFEFESDPGIKEARGVEEFGHLFATAIRLNTTEQPGVWAELSGGIDSSSVVSMVQTLANRGDISCGLDGTISMVDTLGWGDERQYSDAVVRKYSIRNIQIPVPWPFVDDGAPPPNTDLPNVTYGLYAGQRKLNELLRQTGCRRLLSGLGPDHYLGTITATAADLLVSGKLVDAARVLFNRAAKTRHSVWRATWRYALIPLLPTFMRRRVTQSRHAVPQWIRRQFATECALTKHSDIARRYSAPWRHKAVGVVAYQLADLVTQLHPSRMFDDPSVRYPFLYRPLVEYALRLPPQQRGEPHRNKLVLRRAIGSGLPEVVLNRTGKGRTGTRAIWAFTEERLFVESLLRNPVLRELGCISTRRLADQVSRAQSGADVHLPQLMATLSLELWLRVKLGRWSFTKPVEAARAS